MASLRARAMEWATGALVRRGYDPQLRVERLRRLDVRRPPRRLAGCRVERTTIADVPCGSIDPPRVKREGTLVYLHGGGYVSGPNIAQWRLAARLSRAAGIRTVVALYRRAPEHPFPAAYEDANGVVDRLGADLVAGDSAGGGLAAAVALAADVRRLLLFSPWLDLRLRDEGIDSITDRVLSRDGMAEAGRLYAGDTSCDDHRLSPLEGDLSQLPPTMVQIGTRDIMLPDCRRFRDRAAAVGADVDYVEMDGMFHDWTAAELVPESADAFGRAAQFLTRS
jgi:monoterpene epsilon-lactone hydrolase